MGIVQPLRNPGIRQARQHAFEQAFAWSPDSRLAQGHRQRASGTHGVLDTLERADVLRQAVVHQHFGLALGLQAVQHALHARDLPTQHRFRQFEHVVARHVQDRGLDLVKPEFAFRIKQRKLLHLLVRSQQVAFHAIGEELQRALTFLARCDPLPLSLQPLRDPLRQRGALHRIDLNAHAGVLQRAEPRRVARGLVEPGQHEQQQGGFVADRTVRQLLDGRGAILSGFTGRHADFNQLPLGEQAHRSSAGQYLAPVEMGAGHRVHRALAIALGPGRGTQGVGRLLHEQRLVAVQDIQRPQALAEVAGQMGSGQLHGFSDVTARGGNQKAGRSFSQLAHRREPDHDQLHQLGLHAAQQQ